MTCATTENPFELVQNALWTLLDTPLVNAQCKRGNQIKLEKRGELKENVGTSDLPEIVILNSTVSANLMETSSSSRLTRQYSILLSTGDFRYSGDEMILKLEWAIWCSLTRWCEVLTALQYNNNSFVKRVGMPSGRSGLSDKEANRGIRGWTSVWTCEVEMHFRTADLRQEVEE